MTWGASKWILTTVFTVLSVGMAMLGGCGANPPQPPPQQQCAAGQSDCGGACVNLSNSSANCGTCGNACGADQICAMGQCMSTCPSGTSECGGTCLNLKNDVNNCGACGNVCDSFFVCSDGDCRIGCPIDKAECNRGCTNILQDKANCGGCGNACDAGQVCNNGNCEATCHSTLTNCGGACANLKSDVNNCGACGTTCESGDVCSGGTCKTFCDSGLLNCGGGVCTNRQTDIANCGFCDTVCPVSNDCIAGQCRANCSAPLNACGTVCVDLTSNNSHCGGCGNSCSRANATTSCSASSCNLDSCNANFQNCNGSTADGCEVDIRTDPNHCNGCGQGCPIPANANPSCTAGTCGLGTCLSGFGNCDGNAGNGCETTITNNNNNCGVCGRVCNLANATSNCSGSNCVITSCNNGFRDCNGTISDGCETNITSSNSHCGNCGAPCDSAQACVGGICVGTGNLQFSLTWNRPGDMDLVVTTPSGASIYWDDRAADGGQLDRDDRAGSGPENIFWATGVTPPSGNYHVCAQTFDGTGSTPLNPAPSAANPVNFSVRVQRPGQPIQNIAGSYTAFTAKPNTCVPGSPTFVVTITFP